MDDFTEIGRKQWSSLSNGNEYISANELTDLAALGDVIDMNDVNEIYIPLVKFLHLFAQHKKMLSQLQSHFIGVDEINHW